MILRISLKPLDKFFFGGENSFNEGNKSDRDPSNRRSTYILHSRHFPQQTGALGLIRNQLLLQSGLLADNTERIAKSDRAKARLLIGRHNFRKGYTDNYGVIKRISPVYLEAEDGQICPPAPLDDCLMKDKDEEGKTVRKSMTFNLENQTLGILDNYREKSGVYPQYQYVTGKNESPDILFQTQKQVGITKAVKPWDKKGTKKDDESGFYYQEFLSFRPIASPLAPKKKDASDPSFYVKGYTFFVELENSIFSENGELVFNWTNEKVIQEGQFTLQNALVEFGGERSTFEMLVNDDFKEWPAPPTVKYLNTRLSEKAKQDKVKRIICLSPCWIEDLEQVRDHSVFRVTQSIPFRFLQSDLKDGETSNFQQVYRGRHNKRKNGLLESKLFHFLDRGSVLYCLGDTQAEEIEKLLDQEDLKNIGYNQIHIIDENN